MKQGFQQLEDLAEANIEDHIAYDQRITSLEHQKSWQTAADDQ